MQNLDELRKQILPVLVPCGVERIALFGSVVREEATETSDVDILVTLKPRDERPPLGMFRWIELEQELSRRLHRQVDLVTEDGLSPFIRPFVDAEKVILYEER